MESKRQTGLYSVTPKFCRLPMNYLIENHPIKTMVASIAVAASMLLFLF
jgi:hypothetical protein